MFKISKLAVDNSGKIQFELFDLAQSSILNSFDFFSGGTAQVPLLLSYESDEYGEFPVCSDILTQLFFISSDDSFSQKYTFEKYPSSSEVYFKSLDSGKSIKCNIYVPKSTENPTEQDYYNELYINSIEKFTKLIPDDSGKFYISSKTDFSDSGIFFLLEFNIDSRFVSNRGENLNFDLGFGFSSLTSEPEYYNPPAGEDFEHPPSEEF